MAVQTEIRIRNHVVKKIMTEMVRLLNDLCMEFDFNRAELLLAFNEVMLVEWNAEEYLSTKR